jgi:hypothetical protein
VTGERSGQAGWHGSSQVGAQVPVDGGRIHQFLWHVRACQLREAWNLATRDDQKPFRVGSSNSGRFRAWVNRSYPEGNRLLLCISTGREALADSIKPFETAQREPSKDGQTERTHREDHADPADRVKTSERRRCYKRHRWPVNERQPES